MPGIFARWLDVVGARFRTLVRRSEVERELEAEFQFHLEQQTEENRLAGMDEREARLAARRAVGDVEQLKEVCRDQRRTAFLEHLAQDIRYAWRMLLSSKGFTLTCILSLGIGIGANSAMFSFVDAILLRPIDVPKPNDIVRITTTTKANRLGDLSYRELTELRAANTTTAGLAAERPLVISVQPGESDAARITLGNLVNHDYFRVLNVQPASGRTFLKEEDSAGARQLVAIISDAAWKNRFLTDPNILGRRIKINGQPVTVVGVLPPKFATDLYVRHEFYLPLAAVKQISPASTLLEDPKERDLQVRARLKDGVSLRTAQADFAALGSRVAQAFPDSNRDHGIAVLRDLEHRFQRKQEDMFISIVLLFLVGLVLLIASVNVANLLLARASSRAREIAIRMSIGATRGRLIRQLLTESLLLAAGGAAAGLAFAVAGIDFLKTIAIPTDFPIVLDVRLDQRVLLFTLAVAFATALLFGLAPALHATRPDLVSPVKGKLPRRRRFAGRHLLVSAQAALSAVLLISAGLFAKSFRDVATTSPGYRVDNILLSTFMPSVANIGQADAYKFYGDIVERVRALPGVESATLAQHVNLGDDQYQQRITIDGYQISGENQWLTIANNYIGSDFFRTTGTPLLSGRAIDDRDSREAPRVAIVNEAMAQKYWPGASALGKVLRLADGKKDPIVVIGVARNAKYFNGIEQPMPYFYLPLRQYERESISLLVHTTGDPLSVVPAIRAEVKALAPGLPMADVRRMRELFENKGLLASRLIAQMTSVAGVAGLALALVGLYAVMAFLVGTRTKEIGIRMAIGATRGSVEWMILAAGLRLALAGLAVGLAVAAFATPMLNTLLSNVSPRDPVVFGLAAAALGVTAALSSWIPARFAASVDPKTTLRLE